MHITRETGTRRYKVKVFKCKWAAGRCLCVAFYPIKSDFSFRGSREMVKMFEPWLFVLPAVWPQPSYLTSLSCESVSVKRD